MAIEHFMDLYAVRVRKKFNRGREYHLLGSCGENEIDAAFVINDFLTAHSKFFKDEVKGDCAVREDEHKVEEKERLIYGLIKSGRAGAPFAAVNSENPVEGTEYDSKFAAMRKFFFLFYLPNMGDTGVLVLHRIGGDGIHGHVVPGLRRFFASAVDDCILEVTALHEGLKEDTVAALKKLKVIAYRKKTKAEVAASKNTSKSRRAEQLFTLSVPIQKTSSTLLKKLMGSKDAKKDALEEMRTHFEIDWDDFIVEPTAIVQFGKRNRTVKITKEFSYNTLIEITKALKFGDDGRPTIESLKAEALEHIQSHKDSGAL